ncbi:response regulator [Candidatus Falkowbacteria bacterium]|uniref:Response regulator n=1 Tax=Candidatus Buchananbacteria bacterium CG10_big_fil_rev_8_21_14_0_10_33_19 TaxID=1974525 RepID=A0A2H0W4C3_9BACT|nr:response regulator [Candidatus Falkowbacteria bacterium]PIS06212.1 MAG: response regulator [Candidatus Buchananbacteria bacterium CG10_big_fil_rev_8_21_14_0_10_33_19]
MNKKILVIEDDNILQSAIATSLKQSDFDVEQAFNGDDGIKMSKNGDIDLILLDLLLPKKDGWEVLESLKKDEKSKDIPVFVLTVYEGEDSISKCMDLGANGYFIKSKYSLDEMIEKIKEEVQK